MIMIMIACIAGPLFAHAYDYGYGLWFRLYHKWLVEDLLHSGNRNLRQLPSGSNSGLYQDQQGPERPHQRKDAPKQDFWHPPSIEP